MGAHFLTSIMFAISIPILFMLYKQLYPAGNQPQNAIYAPRVSSHLRRHYKYIETLSIIPFIVLTAVSFFPWRAAVNMYVCFLSTPIEGSNFIIRPPESVFSFLAYFLAVATGAYLTILTIKFLLKNRYEEFIMYVNIKLGFNNLKVVRNCTLVFYSFSLIFIMLCQNNYIAFTDKHIVVSDFFQIGQKEYSYSQIKNIEAFQYSQKSKLKIVKKTYFKIEFNDGYIWMNSAGLHRPRPLLDNKAIRFAASRSNKEINYTKNMQANISAGSSYF